MNALNRNIEANISLSSEFEEASNIWGRLSQYINENEETF